MPWRRERLPTPVFWPGEFHGLYSPCGCKESDRTKRLSLDGVGFQGGDSGKEPTCNAGDLGSIPGLGRCPEEGKGYPLQYSGLENSMDYTVPRVTKSGTQLSHFHFQYSCPDNSIDRGVLRATGHGVTKNRT